MTQAFASLLEEAQVESLLGALRQGVVFSLLSAEAHRGAELLTFQLQEAPSNTNNHAPVDLRLSGRRPSLCP